MMLVDSHCHLDFPELASERAGVLARARAAGIGTLLTISTKITEFETIRAIAESDPDIWCTVGIHPHEAEPQPETSVDRFVALTQHPKVVGIGEAGLDFYYDHSPRDRQRQVFLTQIRAAREAGVPLVVHTRDADADTAAILAEESQGGALRGVLHCFSSGMDLAMRGVELGFYISFSGMVTFKKADALRDVVRAVPLERILVETDSPFLAPVPMRGKRNEPAFVVHTARAVAQLKEIDEAELAAATTANFYRLFDKVIPAAS
jgi:TatD DNase family protein